jgi:hypothetical protein
MRSQFLNEESENAVRLGSKTKTIVCSGSYMGIVIYLVCAQQIVRPALLQPGARLK